MESREQIIRRIESMAKSMRKHALNMAFSAGANGAHVGSGLSIIEITATLYGAIMNLDPQNPEWEDRDRFILSKGHGTLGYYTALAAAGFFTLDELYTFEVDDGFLPGQPAMNIKKGIESSSGSLGMGLSMGIGIALSAKRKNRKFSAYVLMGDGECNEGSVWEAAMAAANFKLDNLVAIIDRNRMQSDGPSADIMDMGDFAQKWSSFGWDTIEIDGHDISEIYGAFTDAARNSGKPYVVIANTVKGKGVSFMENNNEWHHNRLSKAQHEAAMLELGD